MKIKEYLLNTVQTKSGIQINRSRVQCVDGYSMSVQASEYHYCTLVLAGILNTIVLKLVSRQAKKVCCRNMPKVQMNQPKRFMGMFQ